MGPVPNVVGCPKGLLKDFRAAFVGVLALGVEVPTARWVSHSDCTWIKGGLANDLSCCRDRIRCNACTFQPSSSHSSLQWA